MILWVEVARKRDPIFNQTCIVVQTSPSDAGSIHTIFIAQE
jgi:hypothetical protein